MRTRRRVKPAAGWFSPVRFASPCPWAVTQSLEIGHPARQRLPNTASFYMLLHVTETREPEDIAALLQRVMRDTGIKQSRIAELSGIPIATISAWVRGARVPSKGPDGKQKLRDLGENVPGVTVAEVFRAAGISVPGKLTPAAEQRVLELYKNLSPGRQRIAAQLLETLNAEERETVDG